MEHWPLKLCSPVGMAEATAARAATVAKMVLNCILKRMEWGAEELGEVGSGGRVEWSGVLEWSDDERDRRTTPFGSFFIPFEGREMSSYGYRIACLSQKGLASLCRWWDDEGSVYLSEVLYRAPSQHRPAAVPVSPEGTSREHKLSPATKTYGRSHGSWQA